MSVAVVSFIHQGAEIEKPMRKYLTRLNIAGVLLALGLIAAYWYVQQQKLNELQQQAQAVLDAEPGDPHGLDRDGNRIACESLPRN